MPVLPGDCKVPVNVMTFGFSFCMEGMKSATATYIILHCYLSVQNIRNVLMLYF